MDQEARRRWIYRWLKPLIAERKYGYSAAGYQGWLILRIPLKRYIVAFRQDDGALQFNW